jgi:hypothetical protein
MRADPNGARLTPLGILARLRAILEDPDLTPARKVAVARVVLCADKSGRAWPGRRFLARICHLSHQAVSGALAVPGGSALGKHLEPVGRGPHGVQIYRVLPVPDGAPSGPAGRALPQASSGSPVGALAERQRPVSDASAAPFQPSSGPVLTPQRSASGYETSTTELVDITGGELDTPRPHARCTAENGSGMAPPDLDTLARQLWNSGPHPPGQSLADCLGTLARDLDAGAYTLTDLSRFLVTTDGSRPPFWEFKRAIPDFLKRLADRGLENLARLFATAKKGDVARRKADGARGTVWEACNVAITVRLTDPEIDWPRIETAEQFQGWDFSPPDGRMLQAGAETVARGTET